MQQHALNRMERAAVAWSHCDMSPKRITICRRMAAQGAVLKEIMEAIGWEGSRQQLQNRLKKLGIRLHRGQRAHWGESVKVRHGGYVEVTPGGHEVEADLGWRGQVGGSLNSTKARSA